ncbi:MAG: flagellar type III secretion system protein FliR [Syntrophomonadaceae bacterium]|nr:flagellar type III secretion system protein FliR [Syntrophomonadaceae bacterium]
MLAMESLLAGFLVFARLSAFIFLVPFFSIKGTPNLVKIGFAIFLTALLLPGLNIGVVAADMPHFSLLVIKEVLVGLILGFVSLLSFAAIRIAGSIIDIQIGFAMATVFDPQNQSRITLMGQFFYIFQILLFLSVDGHHSLLRAISYSYELLPVMGGALKITVVPSVIQLFIQVFSLGIRIAAPFFIVFLICDIALGIIARTVPQLNIFILSFPIKTGLGMITLIAAMPLLTMLVNNIFSQMERDISLIMGLI